jgi:hypothetical protein
MTPTIYVFSMKLSLVFVAAVAALGSASACKNDPPVASDYAGASGSAAGSAARAALQPILDKAAPMVKAKRAASLAVAAEAAAAPPVTAPEPLAAALPAPPVVGNPALKSPGDTLFGTPEIVGNPDAKVPFAFWVTPLLGPYEDMLAPTSNLMMKPEALEADLASVDKVKYALMVRVREYKPSKVVTAMVGEQGELRYEAGSLTGDAIFYDLDAKKRLGAFPFSFEAAGDYRAKPGATPEEETAALEDHLRASVRTQLVDALATFASGGGAPTATATAAAGTAMEKVERAILVEVGIKHPAVAIGKVTVTTGGAKPLVTIAATNPAAIDDALKAEIAAFAAKQIGADVDVTVVTE